jgi:tight adherence protein B
VNIEEVRTSILAGAWPALGSLPPRPRRAAVVAQRTGAPLVPALDAAIAAERDRRRRVRAVEVATAQARAVLACLAALPPLAVAGIGRLLGEELWRFYLTPTGGIVGLAGVALGVTGALVARLLVRRATRPEPAPPGTAVALAVGLVAAALTRPLLGLATAVVVALWLRRRSPTPPPPSDCDEIADLLATALRGGLSPAGALRTVAGAIPDTGVVLRRAALAHDLGIAIPLPPGVDRVDAVLRTASEHGTPAAPALRRLAEELREQELARAVAATERLPALLAFPTALFLLPASVLLVGAPLLAAGLAEVAGGIR